MRKTWTKLLCALLLIISLPAGVLGMIASAAWYYDVPEGMSFYDSSLCWNVSHDKLDDLYYLTDMYRSGESGYSDSFIRALRERLDPANTNFRYLCRTNTGQVILGDPHMEESVYQAVKQTDWTASGYDPVTGEPVTVLYEVYFGVADPLVVQDEYMNAQKAFDWMNERWSALLAGSIGCLVLAVALLVLLIRFAGRRVGREGIVLNRQDRIPFDLYLVLSVTLICTGIALCAQGIDTLIRDQDAFVAFLVWVGVFVTEVLALALIMTVAARVKSRTVFRNTLIWRLCLLIRRGLKALFAAIPLIWKAALAGGAYLVISLALILSAYRKGSGFLLTLWFILTLICVIYVLWWALQWKRVRMGTREIIGGNPDYHINSRLMSPDMKRHADELNNLGSAISTAVEERLKSERFKAELITNVSHDLKTPLTSIINYVDLLKKEEISNETAREYIGVLDRKSQRLKKLTEDLIEASKASTGALSVTRERLDLKQLIRQAAGEYEEKLTGAGLTLCIHLPDEPVHILADGRHMWRVLDNLLGNCVKYALEGTRIYVDVKVYAGQAAVTVKNISRQPLNIPAGQLMDRFVRGDESRTTEGSGLGLSIARSLTELQQGSFDLEIDGDLFKVTVKIPLAQE